MLLPEGLVEQGAGIGNDAVKPGEAGEGIAALRRLLEPLLPLAGLFVVGKRFFFMPCPILIQGQQEVEGRLHLLALTLAKIQEGQLAGRGLMQHLGHGPVTEQAELGHQAEAVASGGIVQIRRRGPAGHPLTEAVAPLAEGMTLLEYLIRIVGGEATLARQGQLGVVGLGLQLGDQMVQCLGTLLVQRCVMGQQPGQRILPVRGGRPRQTGAEETVQGRVTHVLLAVTLEPLIEMTSTSGWVHRRFLWI